MPNHIFEGDDERMAKKDYGLCTYCDQPVLPSDEKVWRGRGKWAHYTCWGASDDGA